jgi:hypothetical protein
MNVPFLTSSPRNMSSCNITAKIILLPRKCWSLNTAAPVACKNLVIMTERVFKKARRWNLGVNSLLVVKGRWSAGGTGGRSYARYSGNSQNSRIQEAKGDLWCLMPSLPMVSWIESYWKTLTAI